MSNDTGFVITSRWPVISSVPLKAPKMEPKTEAHKRVHKKAPKKEQELDLLTTVLDLVL